MKIPRFPKQHWTVTASGCVVVLWLITLVLWRVELETVKLRANGEPVHRNLARDDFLTLLN